MSDRQRQDRKAARRERAKRAERQRRLTADRCADLFNAAVWARNRGDREHARQLLEKILRIRPNHQAAHERLTELDFGEARFDAGLAHYDTLSQPPEWPVLTYHAAVASATVGRFSRARLLLDEFLRAASRQPEFGQLRANARVLRQGWAKLARKEATHLARTTSREHAGLPMDGELDAAPGGRTAKRLSSEPAWPLTPVAAQAGAGAPPAAGDSMPVEAHPSPVPELPAFPDEVVPEVPVVF